MIDPSHIMAFTAGLLGGIHCIGMCGPIVASYTLQTASPAGEGPASLMKILPHLMYNLGRIVTYTFIGALMGLTGSFVNTLSGFQNMVMLVAGSVMIFMGIGITGFMGGIDRIERRSNLIFKAAQQLSGEQSLWKYYILGALFGFLPCGLSYSAFMAAAGTGSIVSGMLLALLFGLGTLPWLLLFGIAASYISTKIRGMLYKAAGVIVIVMGILFIYRGIKIML